MAGIFVARMELEFHRLLVPRRKLRPVRRTRAPTIRRPRRRCRSRAEKSYRPLSASTASANASRAFAWLRSTKPSRTRAGIRAQRLLAKPQPRAPVEQQPRGLVRRNRRRVAQPRGQSPQPRFVAEHAHVRRQQIVIKHRRPGATQRRVGQDFELHLDPGFLLAPVGFLRAPRARVAVLAGRFSARGKIPGRCKARVPPPPKGKPRPRRVRSRPPAAATPPAPAKGADATRSCNPER